MSRKPRNGGPVGKTTLKAMANLTINFGMVSAPVKLYSPNDSDKRWPTISSLCPICLSKLRMPRVCDEHGKIDYKEAKKGYEFVKGEYVVVEDSDILKAKSTDSLDVREFVPLDTVPPRYFLSSYYVGPGKGGAKAFALLSAALRRTGRAAIAQIVMRGKPQVVAICAHQWGMIAHVLQYHENFRDYSEIDLGDEEVTEAEVDMAVKVFDIMSSPRWDPTAYVDELRHKQMEILENLSRTPRMNGLEPRPQSKTVDLMEQLKASLEASP